MFMLAPAGRRARVSLVRLLALLGCAHAISAKVLFEAAFQGTCAHNSPCDHTCFNLHDGTYECDCRPGYILDANGYKCNSLTTAAPEPAIGAEAERQQRASGPANATLAPPPSCHLACASGRCVGDAAGPRCACPLGIGGDLCEKAADVHTPRFAGDSFVQFKPPVDAHTEMRLTLEFRPEEWHGLLLLSGQAADLVGDFLALLLTDGFVELRFDCGSGLGVVRSREPVVLDRWNQLTVIRTRSYVWMQLNNGQHTEGMSQICSPESNGIQRIPDAKICSLDAGHYLDTAENSVQEVQFEGIFWHITFELPLYVGGVRDVSGVQQRVGVVGGYRGCIRRLEINRNTLDFRPQPLGGVRLGWDIGECRGDLCSRTPCQHGGKCVSAPDGSATCLCPLGFLGELCEKPVDLQVPSFNGSSHLKFPALGTSVLSYLFMEITLKPTAPGGIILYNGFHENGQGEFVALSMRDGHVEFAFDLGAGVTFVRDGQLPGRLTAELRQTCTTRVSDVLHVRVDSTTLPVELHTWHVVRAVRTGREAVLEVDQQPAVVGRSQGGFTQLSLPQNLYLGGMASYDSVSSALFLKDGFQGCIQKLVINEKPVQLLAAALSGYNVANCAHPCVTRPCDARGVCVPLGDTYRCQCRLGSGGRRCRGRLPPPRVARFSGASYLLYRRPALAEKLRGLTNGIEMKFRTRYPSGLLMWTGSTDKWTVDFLAVGLEDGHVHLRFDLGSGVVTVAYNASRVDDGDWHRVQASRVGRDGVISVDGSYPVSGESPGLLSQLDTDGQLFVGGTSELEYATRGRYQRGLDGCIAEVIIAPDHVIDLTSSDDGRDIGYCL